VHISYREWFTYTLKYATNASGSWVTETLDAIGWGGATSIGLDSSDNVHISYHVDIDSTKSLKYATNASGSWVTDTVDRGINPSIALDSSDNVHISYHNNDLMYATNASGSWATETVDSSGWVGWYSSIALDSLENVYISYYDISNGDLKLAVGTGAVSVKLTVPNGGEVIPSGSLYTIQWRAAPEIVSFNLKCSMNNGRTWKPIDTGITDTSYDWQVPTPRKNKTKYLVKVIGYDTLGKKVGADSSDPFTIEVLTVTSPSGGEICTSGDPYTITWTTNETKNPVEEAVLKYTRNGGRKWKKITTIEGSNPGTCSWTVPDVPKTKSKCKVKVVLKDAKGKAVGSGASDSYFTIEPVP
jgi:hypothetical protein